MSAALKTTTVLSGLALVGAASVFSVRSSTHDFSRSALVASELGMIAPVKERIPSNFSQFHISQFKWNNAGI